jgi:hypothetical protein
MATETMYAVEFSGYRAATRPTRVEIERVTVFGEEWCVWQEQGRDMPRSVCAANVNGVPTGDVWGPLLYTTRALARAAIKAARIKSLQEQVKRCRAGLAHERKWQQKRVNEAREELRKANAALKAARALAKAATA